MIVHLRKDVYVSTGRDDVSVEGRACALYHIAGTYHCSQDTGSPSEPEQMLKVLRAALCNQPEFVAIRRHGAIATDTLFYCDK